MTRLTNLLSRSGERYAKVLCVAGIVVAMAASLISCGSNNKTQKKLEQSRLDVLSQVRSIRAMSRGNVHAGDLITGSYRICKKGSVNYVARTDWIDESDAKINSRAITILVVDLKDAGWASDSGSGLERAVLRKADLTAELIEPSGRSVVTGYVSGACHYVGGPASGYVHRSVDEYDK